MVTIERITRARTVLAPVALSTPVAPSPHLGRLVGTEMHLKLENLQRTGSFKIRGAYIRLARLAQTAPHHGVVAASAGNHAQGVALAANLLGLKAIIYMPVNASLSKRDATAAYGAEVRLEGDSVEECLEAARTSEPDLPLIHPYDDEDVICGQGTIGLEIMETVPDLDAVVVPVGGGGLLAGVAAAIKNLAPKVRVIGVEPARAASASAALEAGRPVEVPTLPTLADGARVALTGDRPFPLLRDFVDRIVQVRENHIAQAMLLLLERRRIVAEGAGALPLAAFLAGALPELQSRKVVLVISGGNVDANLVGRIIDQGLVRSGRIFRFSVLLEDLPGSLARLLTTLAQARANVMHIHHDRLGKNLPVSSTRVGLELETRGFEHAEAIAVALKAQGYEIVME